MLSFAGMRRWTQKLATFLVVAAALPCLPASARAGPQDSLTISFSMKDIWPPAPITDLTATAGTEGQVLLGWTAPDENGALPNGKKVHTYTVRIATFSADSVGSTTTWWNMAADVSGEPFPPLAPPSPQSMILSGLDPGATYFFAIKSADNVSLVSPIDTKTSAAGQQAWALVYDAVPPAPSGLVPLALGSSTIQLSWTPPSAPDLDYYRIFIDSTPPFDFGDQYVVAVDSTASVFLHEGLAVSATYYYRMTVVDKGAPAYLGQALESAVSASTWTVTIARPLPPAPAGLSAVAGMNKAFLTWTDNSASVPDFVYYKLYRSTKEASDFVSVTTTTAVSYTDRFLTPFTSYYYRLVARDSFGLESVQTSTVSVLPYNIPPEEPHGVRSALSADGSSTTFSWSPTASFDDGTPFDSAGTPTVDELQGYRILRSATPLASDLVFISSVPVGVSSYTAFTGGDLYYYRLQAYNSAGGSDEAMLVSGTGLQSFILPDNITRLVVSDDMAAALDAGANGLGDSIDIERRFRPEDVAEDIFTSVEFRARRNGLQDIPNFSFDKPATVILRYSTGTAGAPAPMGAAAAGAKPAALSAENLGIFWYNGADFKKLYGKVDTAAQTVSVQTPNIGIFQIRALLRSSGAVFDLSNLSGRVFTPNGDHKNDLMVFGYDPGPRNIVPAGKIYDLKGMFVADMTPGLVPFTLVWDGRMNGKVVAGGVYVYEIKGDGKTFSGTIVVAK
jgi:hypothetical protein